jgi:hypothetical protein
MFLGAVKEKIDGGDNAYRDPHHNKQLQRQDEAMFATS